MSACRLKLYIGLPPRSTPWGSGTSTRHRWLLRPHDRALEIWRGGQQGMAERLENANRLDGPELAEGLALELEEIWAL